jgi:hypothetical protein
MQDISLDDLAKATGGFPGGLPAARNAVSTLKAPANAMRLGGASYDLEHSGANLERPRTWLDGSSIRSRIDALVSTLLH